MKKQSLIIGMGVSGLSAASFLLQQGEKVVAVDRNFSSLSKDKKIKDLLEKGLCFFHDEETMDLSLFGKVIVSPGISKNHPLLQKAIQENKEILAEVELGLRYLKNPMIAITGSNGKTTTTLLVEHILNCSGKKAKALGNIGKSLTSYLSDIDPAEILVLELSSFQLKWMKSKCFDEAVILNIAPNHLDWHESMEDYAHSKCLIQTFVKEKGPLFISHDAYAKFSSFLKNDTAVIFDEFTQEEKFLELFQENSFLQEQKQNILAAYCLCKYKGVSEEDIFEACKKFKKPPHRMEFVSEIQGVSFYNDSKATNVDAVLHAIDFTQGNVILIAGGSDKGLSYYPWKNAFKDKVKHVVLIGDCAEKIARELEGFSIFLEESLEMAVKRAYAIAQRKDTILLSPGCSSYDMFQNYEHRGNEFKRLVRHLEKGGK